MRYFEFLKCNFLAVGLSATSVICPLSGWAQSQTTVVRQAETQVQEAPSNTILPATTRNQAADAAKNDSGRIDPLAPVTGFKHFPSHDASYVAPDATPVLSSGAQKKSPLSVSRQSFSGSNPYLKIPPPPTPVGYPNELPVSDLPDPPDKPSLANSMKLTGIVGNKAIFAFTDMSTRLKNKFPKDILLGAGERFESVSVISVEANGATLEENGERFSKNLERVR